MKRYKKDNFNFYIYTKNEFIKSRFYKDIKHIKKDFEDIIIILKDKKIIGYLIGFFTFGYSLRNAYEEKFLKEFKVVKYELKTKSQKDLMIIASKLYDLHIDIRTFIHNNVQINKIIKKKYDEDWNNLFLELKNYVDERSFRNNEMVHIIEDKIYKKFILDIINKKLTDMNEIIKYANKINEKAIKLKYDRWW